MPTNLLTKPEFIVPLQKYSPKIIRIRSSSPKMIVPAQALIAAVQDKTSGDLAKDRDLYGRWTENAVGAHLLRAGFEVFYWRERDEEIDFIARRGGKTLAVEVIVSKKKHAPAALARLADKLGVPQSLSIGPGGVSPEEFLKSDPAVWLRSTP